MAVTILTLYSIFAWRVYFKEYKFIQDEFVREGKSIEKYLGEVFERTEYEMSLMVDQIKPNYPDSEYVKNILLGFVLSQNSQEVLAWSGFYWLDENDINVTRHNEFTPHLQSNEVSFRRKVSEQSGNLVFGSRISFRSNTKSYLPAALGARDYYGNFIGSLNINFDLDSLKRILRSFSRQNLSYTLFSSDSGVILSLDGSIENSIKGKGKNANKLIQIISHLAPGIESAHAEINLFSYEDSFFIFAMRQYPIYVYLKYDQGALQEQMWEQLFSRIIELIVISIVALVLAMLVYLRERYLRDITQNALAQAQNAEKAKGEFLAFTAHELRSPLGYISTTCQIMESAAFGKLPERYADYVSSINLSANDLIQFIEDLLDESKNALIGFKIEKSPVSLASIVARALKLNSFRAKKHNILVRSDVQSAEIMVDSRRLLQIINNLVSNAIKYSSQNTEVVVKAYVDDKILKVEVIDQGFGMTEKEQIEAFKKYGTVENYNSGRVESVGLGLPLVKQLVEAHRGVLIVKSIKGAGTTMKVEIPLEENDK